MLPKEPCDKQKRKRCESAMSHQIAKGSGRGSDENDASESASESSCSDELEEIGGIRWTKDAQPGHHVDSNQTPIAQHQRRSPAEQ
jgi:hypothetical protein